jgi:EAL domain-containing protein (putative c-di-GMP-specific phosphodiesterase class I)
MVGQLGDWALRKACEDAATGRVSLRVAVNVSPVQFTDEGLPATSSPPLPRPAWLPNRLELEITEGVFLGDTAAAAAMFAT